MDDLIKSAFSKVKQDILFLADEISFIRQEIFELRELLNTFNNQINAKKLHKISENKGFFVSTDTSTDTTYNTTDSVTSTHNTTVPQEVGGLKPLNLGISIGNEGASTDRQTDRQTDTSTDNLSKNSLNSIENNIQEASEILNSLDHLKKQIRLKFKKVTSQEMAVFSTIYQLEEQDSNQVNYKQIADSLKLSESSIRDYVQRMINKGIPIKKQKINNKKLILSISPELRKIATLSTILQLRDL